MMVPELLFENRIKDMCIKGSEELGKVTHVCLKSSTKHFFLSSEIMRKEPEFVSLNK